MNPLLLEYPSWLISIFIFVLIIVFIRLGRWFRKYEEAKGKETQATALSPIENGMLNLMALLLAFSFGVAAAKFEAKRKVIVDEANALEGAIMRCDLYNDSIRSALRDLLGKYIDTRIAYYDAGANKQKIDAAIKEGTIYYSRIWQLVVASSRISTNFLPTNQTVPTITSVINAATNRESERQAKIPPIILFTLMILIFTGSFLLGFSQVSTKRSKVFMVCFGVTTTVTIFLILELERPWSGLINLNSTEQRILVLKDKLK
jgi:hypothetical protein